MTRVGDFIYSRDLIDLTCCSGLVMTNQSGDDGAVVMRKSNTTSNLTKIRLAKISENPNSRYLEPVQYGKEIYLEFNHRKTGLTKKMNHNEYLNIKNDIPSLFMLYKKSEPLSNDAIIIGDVVLIKSKKSGYLSVNAQGYVSTESSSSDATKFTIKNSLGCGPTWFHDQDTRKLGGKYYSQSQVDEAVKEELNRLQNILEQKQRTADKLYQQTEQECEMKLNKVKFQ